MKYPWYQHLKRRQRNWVMQLCLNAIEQLQLLNTKHVKISLDFLVSAKRMICCLIQNGSMKPKSTVLFRIFRCSPEHYKAVAISRKSNLNLTMFEQCTLNNFSYRNYLICSFFVLRIRFSYVSICIMRQCWWEFEKLFHHLQHKLISFC